MGKLGLARRGAAHPGGGGGGANAGPHGLQYHAERVRGGCSTLLRGCMQHEQNVDHVGSVNNILFMLHAPFKHPTPAPPWASLIPACPTQPRPAPPWASLIPACPTHPHPAPPTLSAGARAATASPRRRCCAAALAALLPRFLGGGSSAAGCKGAGGAQAGRGGRCSGCAAALQPCGCRRGAHTRCSGQGREQRCRCSHG
jgi:hypothetical protein